MRFKDMPIGAVFIWDEGPGVSVGPYRKTGEDYYVDSRGSHWLTDWPRGLVHVAWPL